MSMLSAQIDHLRELADALDGKYGYQGYEIAMRDAADTICELRGALQVASVDYRHLAAENAQLRDSLKALMMGTNVELCADRDEPNCKECSMHHGKDGCTMVDAMELLGIDMYGESLEVKS